MRCLGRTKHHSRCNNQTKFLFCRLHLWPALKWFVGFFAASMGFLYYISHNIEFFSHKNEKATPDIYKIDVFKDTSKFNILIIQYINGNISKEKEFALQNQIKAEIIEEIGESNVDIKIFPENDNETLKDPIPDSILLDLGIKKKATLIIQYGINDYPNENKTITTIKWILPNKEREIPIVNMKNRSINSFKDITKGEITYTSEYAKYISYFSIGLLHYNNGKYNDALSYYDKAFTLLDAKKNQGDSTKLKEILYFKKALCHYFLAAEQDDVVEYENSLNDFKKAIKINPENAESYNNSGLISDIHFDDIQNAEESYKKALSLKPGMFSTLNNYALLMEKICGGCKIQCKGCDSAIVYYHKAMREATKNKTAFAAAYYNLGSLFEKRGNNKLHDQDSALFYYQKTLNSIDSKSLPYQFAKSKIDNLQKSENIIKDTLNDKNINNKEQGIANTQAKDYGTITDADGNVYNTVIIGTQVWMKENLKTTHYLNGDAIPNVTDSRTWVKLTTGAYCNYNNISTNANTYGRLYNCYAGADKMKICPIGWHVPTDAEWKTLLEYIGNPSIAGCKLKSTLFWKGGICATNSSGFTALPGGCRGIYGTFIKVGFYGAWWSKDNYPEYGFDSQYISLSYDRRSVEYGPMKNNPKYVGMSVRCVRDY